MGSLGDASQPDWDALIIGGGLSGIYSLYKLRKLNLRVKLLEAGSGVGGTWYWNRYPGARFDSESYSYSFSWSQELLDQWDWTEHFAPARETEAYANFICDKFDLRKDMQFHTRVRSAHFQEESRTWKVGTEGGEFFTCRFLVTAMGILSTPTLPNIPGVDDYKGVAYHTGRWPKESVSFEGKRVGIIGTGATSIQAIPEIAKTVGHLTVFQRTPNWAIPLHNGKISKEEMEKIRQGYKELFKLCSETNMNFIHPAEPRGTWEVTQEEREALWEHLYGQPGFGLWLSNFRDMGRDREANKLVSDFVANKIRQRVHDPATAEKLIPKHHGFGTRRVPMETNYYEAFNQPNVRLVDINETPIEKITSKGLKTSAEDFEFDMLIYATGFDMVTGAYDVLDIRGINGIKLKDAWSGGPKTYLGITVPQFPNLLMIMGPHSCFGNFPRSIEFGVDWVADCIEYLESHGKTWIEAKPEGAEQWTAHLHDCSKGLLSQEVDSWMTGVNKNVPGKQKRIVARYNGTAPEYRQRCRDVAQSGYATMKLA
ncbi:FAD/NAD(P)-binding domain-containing protein [Rhizodiscina lignyota]|uniref:FAD/NAD(P)-binding domain-containing protein n=1 Tax=Rhizodiscina lignyota TaxID=1504668 RepID=A0A9P4IAG8_9PEZI|nr:FAD/NAD(P)-binding domain-containing protein [Rhizodiscina lignyota]